MPCHPLILATRNPGKMRELAEPLGQRGFDVRLLPDDAPDVEETGVTFAENALLKARAAALATGLPALADDSGLEVDDLGGQPGVRSARYGDDLPTQEGESRDQRNIRKLLAALTALPEPLPHDRKARFHCCMALVFPPTETETKTKQKDILVHGCWEGRIVSSPQGDNGFGYDPVFFDPILNRTAAQLAPEEKMARSHRAQALRLLLEELDNRKSEGQA